MHRLFVALKIPQALRSDLLGAMGGIANARWQREDQLHLTLRFIGDVNRHQGEDIAAALGSIHFPRFSMMLDGTGTFERNGRIDSFWAGVTPKESVTRLHGKVTQALIRAGIPAERRAYLPHITMARFSRSSAPETVAGRNLSGGVSVESEEFALFESVLGRTGADYITIARYPLA